MMSMVSHGLRTPAPGPADGAGGELIVVGADGLGPVVGPLDVAVGSAVGGGAMVGPLDVPGPGGTSCPIVPASSSAGTNTAKGCKGMTGSESM